MIAQAILRAARPVADLVAVRADTAVGKWSEADLVDVPWHSACPTAFRAMALFYRARRTITRRSVGNSDVVDVLWFPEMATVGGFAYDLWLPTRRQKGRDR